MTHALRLFALATLLIATSQALDLTALRPQGYVSDFAGVLDPAGKQELERYSGLLERSTGVQLAIVTLPTLDGEPIDDVANTLFVRWGIGKKGQDEGLLLLMAVNDRRSRLEVGRGLEPYITDGTSGSLLREMRPALREGRWAEALGTAAHSLGQRIASAKGVAIEEQHQPRRRVREKPGLPIPLPVLFGGAFLLFWLMSVGRSSRYGRGGGGGGFIPGLILGTMLNRSSHSGYGGGGFGGYDSSDTFGGFGGGDSGGGGASSDW